MGSSKTTKSYLMFITSMLIFGTIGLFRKYISLPSGSLACTRGLLGGIFLLIFVAVKKHKLQRLKTKQILLLAITGGIMGLNWIALFESYNYTAVSTATMCYYMQPTIVILVSPIFFRERLTLKNALCALVAIIGMVFISGIADGGAISAEDTTGILLGLGAAVLYAAVIVLNKKVPVDDAYGKTVIQLFAAGIILLPYVFLTENPFAVRLDITSAVIVFIVGIFHTCIAYVLYFGSMKDLKSQSIAVLGYIDPVFALLLSALALGEKLTLLGVIGSILIIGSAVISEINLGSLKNKIAAK